MNNRWYNDELYHYGVLGMKWGQRKERRANAKDARKKRKNAIQAEFERQQKNATFKDMMLYNNATRKRAAKLVVDNNMSVADARAKANREAKRNTAILLAAYGAYGAAAIGYYYKKYN